MINKVGSVTFKIIPLIIFCCLIIYIFVFFATEVKPLTPLLETFESVVEEIVRCNDSRESY